MLVEGGKGSPPSLPPLSPLFQKPSNAQQFPTVCAILWKKVVWGEVKGQEKEKKEGNHLCKKLARGEKEREGGFVQLLKVSGM